MSRWKNYSVLVIPDDGSRTREFKMSALLLKALLVLFVIDLALVLGGAFSVWRLRDWGETVEKLRAENAHLRGEAEKVQKLSQALERLKATDQQIRTMLSGGVPSGDPASEGTGETTGSSQR